MRGAGGGVAASSALSAALSAAGYGPFLTVRSARRSYRVPVAAPAPGAPAVTSLGVDVDEVTYPGGDVYAVAEVEALVAVPQGGSGGSPPDRAAAAAAGEAAIAALAARYGIAPAPMLGKVLEYLRRHDPAGRWAVVTGTGLVALKTGGMV